MPSASYTLRASELLGGPTPWSARRLVRAQLHEISAALDVLDTAPDDVRALHQLRVASRQLRTVLRALRPALAGAHPRRHARAVQRLVRRTSTQRDRDVMAALLDACTATLPARVRRALAARRETILGPAATAPAAHLADAPAWRALVARIDRDTASWTATFETDAPVAHHAFGPALALAIEEAAAVLAARLAAVDPAAPEAGEHAARIAGKRLRYLVQPFAETIPAAGTATTALRALQDLLGERRDAHLLLHALAQATASLAPRGPLAAFAALRRAINARLEADARALAPWYSGPSLRALQAALDDVTRAARADAPPLEIERKYLLSALPPRARQVQPAEIAQGYLPGTEVLERIRSVRKGARVRWMRTVKLGRGVSRLEFEEQVTAPLGRALFALTEGARVTKHRYAIREGDRVWEIDEFTDRDLVLAEIELPSADASVEVPAWLTPYLVREVTDDPAFTNAALAR